MVTVSRPHDMWDFLKSRDHYLIVNVHNVCGKDIKIAINSSAIESAGKCQTRVRSPIDFSMHKPEKDWPNSEIITEIWVIAFEFINIGSVEQPHGGELCSG